MANTKRVALIALVCSLVTSLLSASAFGWNEHGHMVVAALAYKKLTPAAHKQVATLLRLNPNYSQWISGVALKNRDRVAFIKAATWADFIKHAPGYKDDGEHPSNPNAGANLGYTDKLMHRYWHFIDMPFSPDGTPLIDPVAPNAKTEIALFRNALKSPTTSASVKSYDLVWLLHLVGDVHQPLHSTSRFTKDLAEGDAGGNKVLLCTAPCNHKLHAFWDDVLGTDSSIAAVTMAASKMPSADPKLAAISDESVWIQESVDVAKQFVYVTPIGVGTGPFTLNAAYKKSAGAVARKRVALAGARLANLMNEVFK